MRLQSVSRGGKCAIMQFIQRFLKRSVEAPAVEEPAEVPAIAEDRPRYGFFGDYKDFDEAARDASEYDSAAIAKHAAAQIPTFFQDDFCEIDGRYQQVHSVLASVMDRLGKSRVSVLDVGGGNGNNFIACSKLSPSVPYDWTILETASMCAASGGKLSVDWTPVLPNRSFDAVLISGTLQYLPEPYKPLSEFARKAPWIIIHRTPLIEDPADRLTIQIVDPDIYPGELLRHCFLSRDKLRSSLVSLGKVAASWRNTQDDPAFVQIGGRSFGFLVQVE
jgi:putative methyltransferase (TIGR04325 family)